MLDSGIGGLPYYKAVRETFPDADVFYVADNAGFPYGTKTAESIRNILFERVRRIRARLMPDILILSCLTAVEVGIRELQAIHQSLPIIGVYPPLKQAARDSKTRTIAMLTTARAAEDSFLDDLVAKEASDVEVLRIPSQDLVEFVEQQFLFAGAESAEAAVLPYVSYVTDHSADRIVIASSHIVYLEEAIHAVLARENVSEVRCLDSRKSLVSQLSRMLAHENDSCTISNAQAETGFFLTGEQGPIATYRIWASRYGLPEPELF